MIYTSDEKKHTTKKITITKDTSTYVGTLLMSVKNNTHIKK